MWASVGSTSTMHKEQCDKCKHMFDYNDLRVCHGCGQTFCIPCAPTLAVAVLQCCNYHGCVVWFCNVLCRDVNDDEYTVRIAHSLKDKCLR